MNVNIIGGGPGGLYAAILLQRDHPDWEITVYERNPANETYGWGIVLPGRMPSVLQKADKPSYESIMEVSHEWEPFDIIHQGEHVRCMGQKFRSMLRTELLSVLQERCRNLGVDMEFNTKAVPEDLKPESDLLIGADGLPSDTRSAFSDEFEPTLIKGKDKFAWFGTDRGFDALTHAYVSNEDGFWRAHAYPGTTSTFAVDCDPETYDAAGLAEMKEREYKQYLEDVFGEALDNTTLRSKEDKWRNFLTVRNENWFHENVVLLGDALHTAHYTVGSGTTMALEDAIALADAFSEHPRDITTALSHYEKERKLAAEKLQTAAEQSRIHFENIKRYAEMDPLQFAFLYFTRTGLLTYEGLKKRDPTFVKDVDHWFARQADGDPNEQPWKQPLELRSMTVPNRRVTRPESPATKDEELQRVRDAAESGNGLVMTKPFTVDASNSTDNLASSEIQPTRWSDIVETVHGRTNAAVGAVITERPVEDITADFDAAPSEEVLEAYQSAAKMAEDADFDMLEIDMAGDGFLASLLANRSNDISDTSDETAARVGCPRDIVAAVRDVWSEEKPLSVALKVNEEVGDALEPEFAFTVARTFSDAGCDILSITDTGSESMVGSLDACTLYSHWIRNETGVLTVATASYTKVDKLNTHLAAGRTDLATVEMSSDVFVD